MASSMGPVIDAILDICRTACPTATVADGYPLVDEGSLFIGVGGLLDANERGGQTPNQIGGYQLREEYDVGVMVSVVSGDTNQKALRDAVLAAYNSIVDEWRLQLTSKTGIALACELSWPGTMTLTQTNTATLTTGFPWFAELQFMMHIISHNS